MKDPTWRIAASSYLVDDAYLRLRRDSVDLPNGTHIDDYYVRESRGFVVIFALTPSDDVVLVEQYKHGIARPLLELPAGAIDPDESAEETARRELLEETGYEGTLEPLARFVTDPTHSNSVAHVFLARNVRKVAEQRLDETEDIAVSLVPVKTLRELVRSGRIESMPHVAAIYYVLDALERGAAASQP